MASQRDRFFEIDQHKLATIVGAVALAMPVAMIVSALFFDVCFYDSISHFYYSRSMGSVFVGSLTFIGAFLVAYQGDPDDPWENPLATLAGVAAFGVALFPTSEAGCHLERFVGRPFAEIAIVAGEEIRLSAPGSDAEVFSLFAGADTLHYLSAGILFGFLAYYCFFVFTRVTDAEHRVDGDPAKPLTDAKRIRNRFYYGAGSVISAMLVLFIANRILGFSWWNRLNATFWLELLALWAFGIAWVVRGRLWNRYLLDPEERRTLSGR